MASSCILTTCSIRTLFLLFFFPHAPPPEIYTLSLHDALPIFIFVANLAAQAPTPRLPAQAPSGTASQVASKSPDRKSTRLNSSHQISSYAAFCLKKKTRTTP